jgi:2,3-bisphosphoglycerate-dependent phosphoglycerate mutase
LGRWFAGQPESERPTVLMSSPYVRARQTTTLIAEAAHLHAPSAVLRVDERLREKEFGILNRLTKAGITAQFPREAELRSKIGKFYYRPPGGESWCDVILRLRSVLDHVQLQFAGERVVIVSHQVVVLCLRYVLEEMTEQQILDIDADKDVANCSLTEYALGQDESGHAAMVLRRYNDVTPLEHLHAEVTTEPDAPVAPR